MFILYLTRETTYFTCTTTCIEFKQIDRVLYCRIRYKYNHEHRVREWCFISDTFDSFFSHIVAVFACENITVLPHSAASLEYRAANNLNIDTPFSHIILTPGQPVLVLSA